VGIGFPLISQEREVNGARQMNCEFVEMVRVVAYTISGVPKVRDHSTPGQWGASHVRYGNSAARAESAHSFSKGNYRVGGDRFGTAIFH